MWACHAYGGSEPHKAKFEPDKSSFVGNPVPLIVKQLFLFIWALMEDLSACTVLNEPFYLSVGEIGFVFRSLSFFFFLICLNSAGVVFHD